MEPHQVEDEGADIGLEDPEFEVADEMAQSGEGMICWLLLLSSRRIPSAVEGTRCVVGGEEDVAFLPEKRIERLMELAVDEREGVEVAAGGEEGGDQGADLVDVEQAMDRAHGRRDD